MVLLKQASTESLAPRAHFTPESHRGHELVPETIFLRYQNLTRVTPADYALIEVIKPDLSYHCSDFPMTLYAPANTGSTVGLVRGFGPYHNPMLGPGQRSRESPYFGFLMSENFGTFEVSGSQSFCGAGIMALDGRRACVEIAPILVKTQTANIQDVEATKSCDVFVVCIRRYSRRVPLACRVLVFSLSVSLGACVSPSRATAIR
jgi:hypothetical protein